MNITAATITIYFVGIVNFQTAGTGREVFVPLGKTGVKHKSLDLVPHDASIVITGWSGAAANCRAVGGTLSGTSTCTIPVAAGTSVRLPPSTEKFTTTARFEQIPKLKTQLCSDVGSPRPDFPYALRMTIERGTLDACRHGDAWISNLTLTDATSNTIEIRIGSQSVSLDDRAVVRIFNTPRGAHMSEEQHFWWYYAMRQGGEGCTSLPAKPPADCPPVASTARAACPCPRIVLDWADERGRPHPAATGVGCSNTNYP